MPCVTPFSTCPLVEAAVRTGCRGGLLLDSDEDRSLRIAVSRAPHHFTAIAVRGIRRVAFDSGEVPGIIRRYLYQTDVVVCPVRGPVVTDEVTGLRACRLRQAPAGREGVGDDVWDVGVVRASDKARSAVAFHLIGPRRKDRTPGSDHPVPIAIFRLVRLRRRLLRPDLRDRALQAPLCERLGRLRLVALEEL